MKTVTKNLRCLLFSCTENEAGCFAIFLFELLELIKRWQSDEKIFNEECIKYPGFVSDINLPSSPPVGFNEYKKVTLIWHDTLTKAFCSALDSTEYIEIRNSLYILFKIASVFPMIDKHIDSIQKKLKKLQDEETRDDIKLLATRCTSELKKIDAVKDPRASIAEKRAKQQQQQSQASQSQPSSQSQTPRTSSADR